MVLRGRRTRKVALESQEQPLQHGAHGGLIEEETETLTLNNAITQVKERKTKTKSGISINKIDSKMTPNIPKMFLRSKTLQNIEENSILNDNQVQNLGNVIDFSTAPRTSRSIDQIANNDLLAKERGFNRNNDIFEQVLAHEKSP